MNAIAYRLVAAKLLLINSNYDQKNDEDDTCDYVSWWMVLI